MVFSVRPCKVTINAENGPFYSNLIWQLFFTKMLLNLRKVCFHDVKITINVELPHKIYTT